MLGAKRQSFKELSAPNSPVVLTDVIQVAQTLTILGIISTLQPSLTLTDRVLAHYLCFLFIMAKFHTVATNVLLKALENFTKVSKPQLKRKPPIVTSCNITPLTYVVCSVIYCM
jgi:hypothetical protein